MIRLRRRDSDNFPPIMISSSGSWASVGVGLPLIPIVLLVIAPGFLTLDARQGRGLPQRRLELRNKIAR